MKATGNTSNRDQFTALNARGQLSVQGCRSLYVCLRERLPRSDRRRDPEGQVSKPTGEISSAGGYNLTTSRLAILEATRSQNMDQRSTNDKVLAQRPEGAARCF